MGENALYSDGEIEITKAVVKGKRGTYDLKSVVGVEAKMPVEYLLLSAGGAFGSIMCITLTSGWTRMFFALWLLIALGAFLTNLFYYRVMIARTVSGSKTKLGVKGWQHRHDMEAAFRLAKEA